MVRKKTNIVVLMGGKSPEFKVSIASGIQVIKNLSKTKYEIFPVVISPDGKQWYLTSLAPILSLPNPLDPLVNSDDLIPVIKKNISGISQIPSHIDIVLIAMHGPCGEDGAIQGMLESTGYSYTGSGVLSSAVGMDKLTFRQLMQINNLPVPKYVALKETEKVSLVSKFLGKPPYFVKPSNQGSSVGASIVQTKQDLPKALKLAWKYSDIALVDQYIKARELTVGVIGGKKPQALPIVEIIPTHEFFDYESKYQDEGTKEIVPASLPKQVSKKVQDLAVEVFKTLNCRGIARVDILLKGKKPYILEINTIPGMTENSLIPKAAKAKGITYTKLLDLIIKNSSK
jgi:D-alanine-D-alanine ligase